MPQLTAEQIATVEAWASEGANLNQVQDRLKSEFGIILTYLDARLLMADIGVRLKDKERPVEKKEEPPAPPAADDAEAEDWESADTPPADAAAGAPGVGLTLTADKIAVPGTIISGKVTFSDGVTATWYMDQMGRLGLGGATPGYQPPKADIPEFQRQLDRLLASAGF